MDMKPNWHEILYVVGVIGIAVYAVYQGAVGDIRTALAGLMMIVFLVILHERAS